MCEFEKDKQRQDTAKGQSLVRKSISNLEAKRRHDRLVRSSGVNSEFRVPSSIPPP